MKQLVACLLFAALLSAQPRSSQSKDTPYKPTGEEWAQLKARLQQLQHKVGTLSAADDLEVDIEVYAKAGEWAIAHPEEMYTKAHLGHALAAVDRGLGRAEQLIAKKSPWKDQKGRLSRAYRSRVDGSVQPYGLLIPEQYDPAVPVRLDVVLHGRAATMTEASFLAAHDVPKPLPPEQRFIQLEVFGRTNNAYRWAGETDVFEAIDSVRTRYNIDPTRIVLRGFSMGGAGAWHIGLHYPDMWAAVEAGAGFADTRNYAKLKEVPTYQAGPLNIYDAYRYAANAFNVPIVGYGGENDPQLRASQLIQEELAREGLPASSLRALFLVGPDIGHKWHPESLKKSNAFIDELLAKGRQVPDRIRFVTYTTRYNRCFWVTIDALEKQYERAEVEGTRSELKTRNVAALRFEDPGAPLLDGQQMRRGSLFEKRDGKWHNATERRELHKRHGLQGPIDDAFREPFLTVDAPASAAREWAKWMRGKPRTTSSSNVSKKDIQSYNLVLFGDPTTNKIIQRINRTLPIRWVNGAIVAGEKRFESKDHTLAMIYPNPLNPSRYVVLNTMHTFGERDFRGTNALLYPRFGDWAVIRKADGEIIAAGLFDENWKLAATRPDTRSRP